MATSCATGVLGCILEQLLGKRGDAGTQTMESSSLEEFGGGDVAHGDVVSGHGGVGWGWGSWKSFQPS